MLIMFALEQVAAGSSPRLGLLCVFVYLLVCVFVSLGTGCVGRVGTIKNL